MASTSVDSSEALSSVQVNARDSGPGQEGQLPGGFRICKAFYLLQYNAAGCRKGLR